MAVLRQYPADTAVTIKPHKPTPLGFLVTDIARHIRRLFDRRLSSHGLTQVQWRAILAISNRPGSSQKTIAEVLEIQPITLTRLMDRMAKGGWVERRADPADRRAVRVYLTAKAEPVLSVAAECSAEVIDKACTGLSKQQEEELLALLTIVKENLAGD
jgi:DNA-binding MarR family transcriptional regulator